MNDFHPWTSRPKRRDWRGWIIAIAAIILLAAMFGLAYDAESAGRPCSAERAAWRYERAHAVKIGRMYPKSVDTTWANLRQCEDGQRER